MNSKEYKHLNEFKGDTNKEISKIRNTIQDMKGEFHKDIENLRKTQIEPVEIQTSLS
jgi:predicted  nucleic acid-binding Zn-ribbon protein